MTVSRLGLSDHMEASAGYGRAPSDLTVIKGFLHVVLTGPDGEVKLDEIVENLVTQVGEQTYGERGAGLAGAPAAAVGMQLGTDTTAPAKTGAGAAVVTFVTASYVALSGAATSAINSTKRRITYSAQWAAGVATANGIAEVVLVNASTTTAQAAATTLARALLSPVVNKGALDTLTVNWSHDVGS